MGFRSEYWRLEPVELPVVWRHCASCRGLQAFVCSERFRVNAQKKVLDAWLLYRCRHCDDTWKYPVWSRCRVADIDPGLRADCEGNAAAAVLRHAYDLAGLRGHAVSVELSERVHIERRVAAADAALPGDVIHLEVPLPCALRLERLLANELHQPRSELQRRFAAGRLLLQPASATALRKPVRDGQWVCFIGGIDTASLQCCKPP